MLVDKQQVMNYIENQNEKILHDKNRQLMVERYIYHNYNYQMGDAADIILGKHKDLSEYEMFIVVDGYDYLNNESKKKDYFTELEINNYSTSKVISEDDIFPIEIDCIEVAKDQWIGATNDKFLTKLEQLQLIRYNTNAQRVMQKIIKGEKEYYVISVNEKAVNEIAESMMNGSYIPDDITLNIPEEEDAVFHYDPKKKQLIIDYIKFFDICDGYHREMGINKATLLKPDFQQTMELRITNFSISKAQQFIFQKDQKTKMKKAASNTMNKNKASNIIVERLNVDVLFELKGCIGRNGEQIPFIELSEIINRLYFSNENKNKENDNMYINSVKNEIRDKFNCLLSQDASFYERKYTGRDILIIVYTMFNSEPKNVCRNVHYMLEASKEINNSLFYVADKVKVALINRLEELLKGVQNNEEVLQ